MAMERSKHGYHIRTLTISFRKGIKDTQIHTCTCAHTEAEVRHTHRETETENEEEMENEERDGVDF